MATSNKVTPDLKYVGISYLVRIRCNAIQYHIHEERDFGPREDECMAVPVGWKEISSLRRDKKQNCSRFLEHGCNKKYVWSQREWYMCEPMEGLVGLKAVPGCEDVPFDIYLHDTVKCVKRLADVWYDIPADYTPDPRTVCQPVPSKP